MKLGQYYCLGVTDKLHHFLADGSIEEKSVNNVLASVIRVTP